MAEDQYSDTDSEVSDIEMENDDSYSEEVKGRGGRGKKGSKGGINLDECEKTIKKFNILNEELNNDFTNIRQQSQGQTRRIGDLATQFEETRVRIDRLLGRSGGGRSSVYAEESERINKRRISRQVSYASADIKPKHEDLGVVQLTVKLENGSDDYGEASDV